MAADAVNARVKVRVRYFAALREALGAEEQIEVDVGSSVGELHARLRASSPRHAHCLASERPLRIALDQVLVQEADETRIRSAAEVAFFPPVTGG